MNKTHGDILHSPNTATNDLIYHMKPEDTTGGLSSSESYGEYNPPRGEVGWICPKCGRGLAPHTSYCPCYMKEPSITYHAPNFKPGDYPFGPSITCMNASNHSEN